MQPQRSVKRLKRALHAVIVDEGVKSQKKTTK
jgi:hypothetical protein